MSNKNATLVLTRNEADVTIVPYMTGECAMGMYTGGRNYPTRDEIAQLAYHTYETRGRENGYDIEDWLRAEQELKHHYE